jgi:hypothetical protein
MSDDGKGAATLAAPLIAAALRAHDPDLSKRLVDPSLRKPDRQCAVLGLSEQDLANLETLAEDQPHVKNHAVRIRRMLAREARRLRTERPKQNTLGEALDELLNAGEPS